MAAARRAFPLETSPASLKFIESYDREKQTSATAMSVPPPPSIKTIGITRWLHRLLLSKTREKKTVRNGTRDGTRRQINPQRQRGISKVLSSLSYDIVPHSYKAETTNSFLSAVGCTSSSTMNITSHSVHRSEPYKLNYFPYHWKNYQNGQNDQFVIFVRNFVDTKQCIFTDLNDFS